MTNINMTEAQHIRATRIQAWWDGVEGLRDVNLISKQEYYIEQAKVTELMERNGLNSAKPEGATHV